MPGETLSLSKSSLAFAKLAATPTEKAWSQAYNAGNLFACLSLVSKDGEELHALQTLGKELFSNLEAEFFTLEEKTLATISEAVEKSTKHIPETITVNFCLSFFKDNALYLFILGGGRVVMKRESKLGILLEKSAAETKLQTASGLLENGDTIILETSSFAENVSDAHLRESLQLNLPSDIAESLSVHMHKKADGDQAAIIVVYHGATSRAAAVSLEAEPEEKTLAQEVAKEEIPASKRDFAFPAMPKLPHFNLFEKLNHRKKLFLSVSVIILILLVVSISLTKQKQESAKNTELFQSIYDLALKNYEEGKGLVSLNPTLSLEDFQKAEKLLTDGKDKLPQGSKEDKQIEDLLAQVQKELNTTSGGSEVSEVTLDETNILSVAKKHKDATALGQNADTIYAASTAEAISIGKKDAKEKTLVKNDDDWQKALAIVPYQANFYLLDAQEGVLKYVPAGNDYTKNNYLKADVDLSKATSMAIDSAIWITFSDGTLAKFLRGEKQSFAIKGLDKPFGASTKIVTDADMTSLYILDPQNSRIIQLDKEGAFQKQYTAGILKSAKDFEVVEKDKTINVLSGDKTYQLKID